MDIKFTRNNGDNFRLSEIDVHAKDFMISSIEIESEYGDIEGRDGRVDTGARYAHRTITVPFYFEAVDLLDFSLIRDSIFRKVGRKEAVSLQEIRRAEKLSYDFIELHEKPKMKDVDNQISRKIYYARLSDVIEIEQEGLFGEGEIVFETVGLPFAISEGTTLNERTFDEEIWQVGQGLKAEDFDVIKYVHESDEFKIYNASDVLIDPRQMEVKITYNGASDNLKITNETTETTWEYDGESGVNDKIKLDGIRSLKNDDSIFSDTNKQLITIESGWNDFKIDGMDDGASIVFDFRFYYL